MVQEGGSKASLEQMRALVEKAQAKGYTREQLVQFFRSRGLDDAAIDQILGSERITTSEPPGHLEDEPRHADTPALQRASQNPEHDQSDSQNAASTAQPAVFESMLPEQNEAVVRNEPTSETRGFFDAMLPEQDTTRAEQNRAPDRGNETVVDHEKKSRSGLFARIFKGKEKREPEVMSPQERSDTPTPGMPVEQAPIDHTLAALSEEHMEIREHMRQLTEQFSDLQNTLVNMERVLGRIESELAHRTSQDSPREKEQ